MPTPSANPESLIQKTALSGGRASLRDYVGIARPDHWIKNIFVLPGAALAIGLSQSVDWISTFERVAVAIIASCLLASANYTINEWLDAETDRHHPIKKL